MYNVVSFFVSSKRSRQLLNGYGYPLQLRFSEVQERFLTILRESISTLPLKNYPSVYFFFLKLKLKMGGSPFPLPL